MKAFLQIPIILLACLTLVSATQAAGVNGLVTDVTTNLPLANAKVFALTFDEVTGDSVFFETCTGKDGLYLIEQMPAGKYNIWCQHPDYFKLMYESVELTMDSELELNFELILKSTNIRNHISGHVYSAPPLLPALIPIAGAKVWLTGNGTTIETMTDEAGKYVFSSIAPGTYTISASAEGHESAIDVETIKVEPGLKIEQLDIHLVPLDPVDFYKLSGKVTDLETGEPIYPAYITVVLYPPMIFEGPLPPEDIGISAKTNEDGTYEIMDIPEGKYNVVCTARGYERQVAEQVDFTENDQVLDFQLTAVTPPFDNFLSGTVYDQTNGDVLPDVVLTLTNLTGPEIIYHSRTDETGYYQFHNIITGKYELKALKRGFYPLTVEVVIEENSWITGFDLKMEPRSVTDFVTLWGHVWEDGPDEVPVYPAHIEVFGFTEDGASIYYDTRAETDGSYKIGGMIPGYYKLKCCAPGYETVVFRRIALFDMEVEFDFYMTPGIIPEIGTITGKVYFDDTDDPVIKAQIHFIDMEKNTYRTYTDESGLYKANLPVGEYIVSCRYIFGDNVYVYHEFYDDVHTMAEATPVTIVKDKLTEGIDFGIPDPSIITEVTFTGRVTDDTGEPIANALVRVWELMLQTIRSHMDQAAYSAYTDENGEYKILIDMNTDFAPTPWPVHAYIIAADKEGYHIEFFEEKTCPYDADVLWAMTDTVFADVDFTLDKMMEANSISGLVTGEGDVPLANAFVVGIPSENGRLTMAFTDENGHYTLANLKNMNYYLMFLAKDYMPEFYDNKTVWEDATPVPADGEVTGIDARLEPFTFPFPDGHFRCMLAGRVMNQHGNPLEGALIMIRNREDTMVGYSITDQSGSYQIEGLPDGAYEVTITKVNFTSETMTIEINSDDNDMMLFDFNLAESLTSIPEYDPSQNSLPTQLALLPNYPNPFNPSTIIDFTLPEALTVNLSIFDILGRKINTLVQEALPPGRYSVIWNGSDTNNRPVSSGVYFYVLETPGRRLAGKLVLNR